MKYNIITIEREYASGGSEIGRIVAGELGIPCYGREVLELAAEKMHTIPERIEHLEESASKSLLYSLSMATKVALGERDGLSEESAVYLAEEYVIQSLAMQGPCVIVGRCAGWALRDRKDVLSVFVHADADFRRKRAVDTYGIPEADADNVLRRFDHKRKNFYGVNTSMRWDDKKGYHMMLDSSRLGIQQCVDIIYDIVKK